VSASSCAYCSYTQGGYGANPQGHNPGVLLHTHFPAVYPSGVEVGIPGAGGYSMLFTSASAVTVFLPQGGTPGVLTSDLVNPTTSPAGVFGGQVLTLQINVDFSAAGIPDEMQCPMGNLVLCDTGTSLDGLTVSQILAIANSVLGGGTLPPGFTVSTLNDLVTRLNEAFDNCVESDWAKDHLCPGVCEAPSITVQPQDSGACPGSPVSFSVTASGTPVLSYQWRKDAVDLSDGGNISGATTATLTIDPAGAGDDGSYDVVVTNACGSETSDAADLKVDTDDADGDGTPNCSDGCPNDPNKTAPGICGCGVEDKDTDLDGTADCNDGCPNDPNKIDPGICGCRVEDTDTDLDGTADCYDECPLDPNKVSPGACGCGVADTDTDADGTADCNDGCPDDPNKTAPGDCGCGVADTDTDGDGTADCNDGCPDDPHKTSPGACGCGVADTDTDGDGTADCNDGCPDDPHKTSPGACGCGVADTDTDGDGTADCNDGCPADPNKTAPGVCGCGVADLDEDADGVFDCVDNCLNLSNPGQEDSDGDGKGDDCDNCDLVSNPGQEDCDDDGVGDACEGEPDCNLNSIPDSCDIASGFSLDLNGNSIPDECEDPGIPFCFGDGTQKDCPCGNNGAPGNGCGNTDYPDGSNLAATGIPSLSNDTLVLIVTQQHPSSLSLFVQGDALVGPLNYGDGLRCIGGHLKRIFRIKNWHNSDAAAPSVYSIPPAPATVSGQSAALGDPLSPGDARYYQVYFRDPDPSFCPPNTFNVTNAISVQWLP